METLEPIGDELGGETGQKITDSVTQVYEACNFQDITGQRISKVVTALKQVEDKVDTLLAAFGEDAAAARRERAAAPKKQANADDDASLMNGPSAPGDGAVSQDDIDALLASFD
jgi:chemotaxis protein CheZ